MAAGILLVIAGVWLVLQANVGDLPGRIVSYKGAGFTTAEGKAIEKVIEEKARPIGDSLPGGKLVPDWVPGF